jgi:hypothetical protein
VLKYTCLIGKAPLQKGQGFEVYLPQFFFLRRVDLEVFVVRGLRNRVPT